MPRFKDQAICIRDLDWSESSQVVVLLTETRGKVRGLAKGSKRQSPSSIQRFSGGIELLTAGQVIATSRPSSELASITEWDLQQDHFALRRDLRAQRVAMYAADLCHAMLADLDPHPESFRLLRDLLVALCGGDSMRAEARTPGVEGALLRFQWGLLADCGYKPELTRDVRRDEELATVKTYTFDPVAGGLTSDKGIADWRVRSETVEALRAVAEEGELSGFEPATLERANRLLCVYARTILDKELPTMGVVLGGAAK
ncbi:DNA repair protein RecO [Algisphaera agarilytica]|uniref:DNA repair protein RecO n=1 Tax=Algisphaera agarilytica TaxID=1385975 RepID=A0A7X0H892_9BACT|nr:DNA repair protein RecO [Algisphaera agarilytica]MBB6429936.1 DNA repair protein RecO (recombination protein O) [Algisphaera agarilytica]